MAKTLLIVRHAKSSWQDGSLRDYERPLLKSGIDRTRKVIRFLAEHMVQPDLIISSHAVRAFETARLLASGLGYPEREILVESNIYYYDADGLYNIALALPDAKQVVMMVGHNPAMTQFANMFLDTKLDYMPTTGVVSIDFDMETWDQLPQAARNLNFYIAPKAIT